MSKAVHRVGMVALTAFVMLTHPIATLRAAWRAYVAAIKNPSPTWNQQVQAILDLMDEIERKGKQ